MNVKFISIDEEIEKVYEEVKGIEKQIEDLIWVKEVSMGGEVKIFFEKVDLLF